MNNNLIAPPQANSCPPEPNTVAVQILENTEDTEDTDKLETLENEQHSASAVQKHVKS